MGLRVSEMQIISSYLRRMVLPYRVIAFFCTTFLIALTLDIAAARSSWHAGERRGRQRGDNRHFHEMSLVARERIG